MASCESQRPASKRIYPSLDGILECQESVQCEEKSPALSAVKNDLSVLHAGSYFWKLRSPTNWFRRRYWLDEDCLRLCYEPSRKPLWSNSSSHVEVLAITDIRPGWRTDVFNRLSRQEEKEQSKDPQRPASVSESQCFSVIYGAEHKSLDLVAADDRTAAAWVRALRSLMVFSHSLHHRRKEHQWLKQQFQKVDKDRSGTLDFEECCKLLALLNIKMDKNEAKKLFQLAGSRTKKAKEALNSDELLRFYNLLMVRPELEELFQQYAKNDDCISADDLQRFLIDEQLMTEIKAQDLISQYEASDCKEKKLMTLAGFTALMTSPLFDILNVNHRSVYQDMDQPLSHYYIASSHNTYLTGNQLTSDSSVEAYIIALERGCRCLELDVWDGPDNEPVITHGQTLTGTLFVRDVLADAIKPYAFKTSPYPLILSIENHLSPEQQDVLAIRFKDILGDLLCKVDVTGMTVLPSPNQLKNKIIIKAKKHTMSGDSSDPEDDEQDEMSLSSLPDKGDRTTPPGKLKKVWSKLLSNLVNVCEAVKFVDFAHSRKKDQCYHMSSFSESKASRLMTESAEDFIRHTERQLVRIYPAGSRADSSNYNPVPFWNVGCQIVALNYQTNGKEKSIYIGRFRPNGNCGYVLKPESLNSTGTGGSLTVPSEQIKLRKHLRIRIISGQNLPKVKGDTGDVIDPYVSVEIHGIPQDHFKYKTRHVADNGFNPVWDETMETDLRAPEVAMLCITVKDKEKFALASDQFVGTYTLPLDSITSGYRHVPLFSADGAAIQAASVFLHVIYKSYD